MTYLDIMMSNSISNSLYTFMILLGPRKIICF